MTSLWALITYSMFILNRMWSGAQPSTYNSLSLSLKCLFISPIHFFCPSGLEIWLLDKTWTWKQLWATVKLVRMSALNPSCIIQISPRAPPRPELALLAGAKTNMSSGGLGIRTWNCCSLFDQGEKPDKWLLLMWCYLNPCFPWHLLLVHSRWNLMIL